ncbi:MAG: SusD/RagB family nutrient-binding outer membrane lipoprotein [Bacteroidetes bacterium]|nr:MAG: SusD/RagB family nutrient-binding outer membrane lipoprotein [Bacteroidota bacterium]
MGNIKISYLVLLSVLLGCDKYGELVIDPNRPTEVHPSLLLTNIESGAFSQVSTGAGFACRYIVFTDGYSTSQAYGWQRAGFDGYSSLLQVHKMMEEAERMGLDNYRALGKFFRAYFLTQMTLTFGDIPYSHAMQGDAGVFKPAYDPQLEVYQGILKELTEANEMLGSDGGEINGDIIYDGDILKWKKLVNSFKLRVLISLSAKEGNSALQVVNRFREIIDDPATYPVFTGLEDQGQLVFLDRDENRYPLFNDKFSQTATYMEQTFVNLLKARRDPRLFLFAVPEKKAVDIGQPGYEKSFSSYGGLDAGAYVNDNVQLLTEQGIGSPLHPRYYSDAVNEPGIAVGYPELQFNLAEAVVRGWIDGDASAYYYNGIRASMEFYGVDQEKIAGYLNERLVVYNPDQDIEQINTQKYLAYFMNSGWEPFYNQRRTGIPEFAVGPATQNGGQVPRRWMYPQAELDNNFENVAEAVNRQFEGNDNINGMMWLLIPE